MMAMYSPGGELEGNAVEDDSFAEALGDPLQPQHAVESYYA